MALPHRWFYVFRPCPYRLQNLSCAAKFRTVLIMRSDERDSLNVELTSRDWELLEIVARAGFLATGQIHHHFFRRCSVNACQKRLRKLATARYLAAVRLSRTEQQLWRLGPAGIRMLTGRGWQEFVVPKRAPANLKHTMAINDLRLWFHEHFSDVQFFAERELKRHGWQRVIPDAMVVCQSHSREMVALAIEVDLATENPGAFARMKLANYHSKLPTTVAYSLVLVPDWRRLKSLARHLYGQRGAHLFALAELPALLAGTSSSRVFVRIDQDAESFSTIPELLDSPYRVSSPEDSMEQANP